MTVISIQTQTNPKGTSIVYKVELSDGFLCIHNSYLPMIHQQNILAFVHEECANDKQWVLSVDEETAFHFAADCLQAEQAALRLIARAEQNSSGLSHKLVRRGYSIACAEAVVFRLIELEILNDTRYAMLWFQSRMARKPESPRYLITTLCNRGIKRHTAGAALKAVLNFENELRLLKKYMKSKGFIIENASKNHEKSNKDYHNKTGNASFLKQKLKYEGFSPLVIRSVWEEEGLCL